jgi:hypothetical protein
MPGAREAAESHDHRTQFLKMADTWKQLAQERERLIARYPESAVEGE